MERHEAHTVAEAARMVSVSPSSLRRAIRKGSLRAAKVGRAYRISRRELARWFADIGGGELFPDIDSSADPWIQNSRAHLGQAEEVRSALGAAVQASRSDVWAPADMDSLLDYIEALLALLSTHLFLATASPGDAIDGEKLIATGELRRQTLVESLVPCRVLSAHHLWTRCRDLSTVLHADGPQITACVAAIVSLDPRAWKRWSSTTGRYLDERRDRQLPPETIIDIRGYEGNRPELTARTASLTPLQGYALLDTDHMGVFKGAAMWALVRGTEELRWVPIRQGTAWNRPSRKATQPPSLATKITRRRRS